MDARGKYVMINGGMREAAGVTNHLPATVLHEHLAPEPDGDEHHTMDELYAYRMAYHANAVRGWLATGIPVVKSWKHSDGEPCFGGGWFIVVAQLATGQVSNHYRSEHWKQFDVPEVELPPEYDGHTPSDALERLLDHASLRTPEPGGEAGCVCAVGCQPCPLHPGNLRTGDERRKFERAWDANYHSSPEAVAAREAHERAQVEAAIARERLKDQRAKDWERRKGERAKVDES